MDGSSPNATGPLRETSQRVVLRTTYRDQVRTILRDRILRRELEPGIRLNETALADELGVSRTPIREAFAGLVQEGLVRTDPERGHFVPDSSPGEVRELVDVLAALETLAIRQSDSLGPGYLNRLEALNDRLGAMRVEADAALDPSFHWHEMLVAGSDHSLLIDMLRPLWVRACQYRIGCFAESGHMRDAVEVHRDVVDALRSDDALRIERAVRRHWLADLSRPPGRSDEATEGRCAR
jgi:DNA-binding GntR family transcriptional regulator